METFKLENDNLSIQIAQIGGNLCSVFDKKRNKELLWPGDPNSWRFQDVVIFPLMGQPDGGYEAKGDTYSFTLAHGVARHERYTEVARTQDSVTIELCSNAETRSHYPYEFRLRLTYRLQGKGYSLTYSVSSLTDEKIPFQVGAHAGFRTEGDFVEIAFDGELPVKNYPYDGKMHETPKVLTENGRMELNRGVFDKEMSLILNAEKLRGCCVTRGDGVKLRYDFGGAPRVTVWGFFTGSHFCCVEPWWGVCESYSSPREITKKELMYFAGREPQSFTYSVSIE